MKSNVEKMKLERKMFRIIEQELKRLDSSRYSCVTQIARCLLEEYPPFEIGDRVAAFTIEAEHVIQRIQQLVDATGVDESIIQMAEAIVNYDKAYLEFVARYYGNVAEDENEEEGLE